jgi:hypothetical protein
MLVLYEGLQFLFLSINGVGKCWFLGGAAMWIDLIDTMMHVEGQGEGGGSRVLAAMWLPSWQRAAAKIGATPKLQQKMLLQSGGTI